ncbi:MAG: putative glycoside hydrolase [Patescibacteria group bacterium]
MFKNNKKATHLLLLWTVSAFSFLLLDQNSLYSVFSPIPETPLEIIEIKKSYLPDYVRGIYLTASSAGSEEFRSQLLAKIKDSRINTVVIDIKDYSGYILYDSQLADVQDAKAINNRMPNLAKILDEFHQLGVYAIARQTVFQDPILAQSRPELAIKTKDGKTWYDKSGLAWLDPAQTEVWHYNLAIAKEAISLGFDEINFDYMRYPSDGNINNINYNIPAGETKASMLEKFFAFLSDDLTGLAPISIDTFGLVLDHTDDDYDLGIGQRLDRIALYFDYVCPMMYPSHYPLTYLGFDNSAEHPGAVISYGLDISSSTMSGQRATLRPWLQAFNIRAIYDQTKINAQAQATEEASTTSGWLLWNARNYYPTHIFEK